MEKTQQLIQTIRELCQADGISGREEQVRDILARRLEGCCQLEVDPRGSLICRRRGQKPAGRPVMLTAHMDEVGFMVTGIGEDGLLSFSSVGDVDLRTVIGKAVRIDSSVAGVVGTKPIHLQPQEERERPVKLEDLRIDIGATSRESAAGAVRLGAAVTYDAPFVRLGGGLVSGKACGVRSACALLLSLLLEGWEEDLVGVFTVSQAAGTSSAANAAFRLNPRAALVLCEVPADDLPGGKSTCCLGGGPGIALRDGLALQDAGLYRSCVQAAQERGLALQQLPPVQRKGEARQIQTACAGVPVLTVGLPCRYPDSPVSTVMMQDLPQTGALVRALVSRMGR